MTDSNEKILLVAQRGIEHRLVTAEGLDALRGAGFLQVLDLLATEENRRASTFDEAAAEVDAVVSLPWGYQGIPPLTEERLNRMPNLRVISGTYDNRFEGWLDVAGALARGIQVIDTSRSMTPTVAEFALAMIINLLRDIPEEVARVRAGHWFSGWQDLDGFVAGDLSGRQVGLAGFGIINRSLARLLTPFHCLLRTFDPFVDDRILANHGVTRAASLTELASTCEIFVVGIPPTPKTLGIISAEVIEALPQGSLFVLVTRMRVVEQKALWRRVEAGELRAAIDVYHPEPPEPGSFMRTARHVIPTPHIAGNTATAHRRCFTTACNRNREGLEGKNPNLRGHRGRCSYLRGQGVEDPETTLAMVMIAL